MLSVNMYGDLIFVSQEEKAKSILEKIWGKTPLFACVIANTEVGKIEGISAAGADPDITDFTPSADVELVELGKCKCIEGVPITPEGIPTPAIITRTSLSLANIPFLAINAGLNVLPKIPFIEVGKKAGKDIRREKAVIEPDKIFEKAEGIGQGLAETNDYVVVGESIAGGTTTALGTLAGLGYDAYD
ncbi:TIGR00303 family protein, partial [bacterium]|nr:TIGR00303 family protein [bacterium]